MTLMLAKMHRLSITQERTILKREDNRMMVLAMNSLKELKQIKNHEGLKKYGFLIFLVKLNAVKMLDLE